MISTLSSGRALAQAANDPPVAVRFVGATSLDSLIGGGSGSGTLIYYLAERGPQHPSLVVRLSKAAGASGRLAEVFDAPIG